MFVLRVLHKLKKGNDKLNLNALHDSILSFGDGNAIFAESLDHFLTC